MSLAGLKRCELCAQISAPGAGGPRQIKTCLMLSEQSGYRARLPNW